MRAGGLIRGLVAGLCLSLLGPVTVACGADTGEAGVSDAGLPPVVERSDDDIVILNLSLNQFTLAEGLAAYQDGEDIWVPLSAMFHALEFPIAVDPENGTARGWYLKEDRLFDLDLATRKLVNAGKEHTVGPAQVERHADDLYAPLSVLETWFPLHLEVDFRNLSINVTSFEPLPIEERIEREKRRRGVSRTQRGDERSAEHKGEGILFSFPFIDTSAAVRLAHTGEQQAASTQYSSTLAGAVAGMDTQISVFGNDSETPTARVRAGRYNPDGGLLGLKPIRQFAIGDVTTEELPLVAGNSVGRGAEISSYDFDRQGNQTRITLRGELAVGWEVELYQNGELIDYITEATDGRFEFKDVQTVPGLNVFALKYYGPQGQKREEYRRYYASAGLMREGQTAFRFAVNQKNRDLIEGHDGLGSTPDDGDWRFLGQIEHGVSQRVGVIAGLSSLPVGGSRHSYGLLGARTDYLGAFTGADIAVSDEGGMALGLRTQTLVRGISVTASHDQYFDFQSEATENSGLDGDLTSDSLLRLSGRIALPVLASMPYTVSARRRASDTNQEKVEIFGRLASRVSVLALSADTLWQKQTGHTADWSSAVRASTLFGNFRLRTAAAFSLKPDLQLDSLIANADWSVSRRVGARFGVRHDMNADKPVTSFNLGTNVSLNAVSLGAQFETNTRGDYSVQFGLSLSWGFDPRGRKVVMRGRNFATDGIVTPFVYLDRNGDSTYEAGEDEPLPDVRFQGSDNDAASATDSDGQALLVNAPSYRQLTVKISEASLKDPFLMPAKKSVSVLPRPGVPIRVEFPVVQVGEVDGTIYVQRPDGPRPLGGISVQVLDTSGRLVRSVTSSFDGYYLIDQLPVGRYVVQMDPAQLLRLGYAPVPAEKVSLTADEPVAFGFDFTTHIQLAPEQTAAAEGMVPGN